MTLFFLAIGLVLVMEGLLYALFPDQVKRMMAYALTQPTENLRNMGLIVALAGAGVLYMFK